METQKNIYQTINAVMKDVDAIEKSNKNQVQNFMFRGIDQFMNELHPLFAKHGLFALPEHISSEPQTITPTKSGGSQFKTIQRIKYTFYALDGSSISAIIESEAMDAGDKGCNKVIAIAFKYVLMQLFMVPTEDLKDPDSESPQIVGKVEPKKPVRAVTEPTIDQRAAAMLKKPEHDIDTFLYETDINNAQTTKELVNIWNTFPDMHNDKGFNAAMAKRKHEILTKKQDEVTI